MAGRAYTGPWPIRSHRTMAEVIRDEATAARVADLFEIEENLEVCERLHRAEMYRSNRAFLAALAEARS